MAFLSFFMCFFPHPQILRIIIIKLMKIAKIKLVSVYYFGIIKSGFKSLEK